MRYKFWVKNGLRNGLLCLIAPIVTSSIQLAVKAQPCTWADWLETLAISFVIVGSFAQMFFGCITLRDTAPLALRFSRTRREILKGIQVSRVVAILPFLVIGAILSSVSPLGQGASFFSVLLLLLGQYLLFSGLGGMLGAVSFWSPERLTFVAHIVFFTGILASFQRVWYGWGGATNPIVILICLALGIAVYLWSCDAQKKRLAWTHT